MKFFLIFARNIDCGYTLEPPLTSTHNLCFRAEIRKNVYPCKPQFFYIKVGCKGVYISRTCYPDEDPAYCHLLRFHHIVIHFAVLLSHLVIHFVAPA